MAAKSFPISSLSIKGYKSIKNLQDFPLRSLNIFIGANGAGKSNFVTFFAMLSELVEQRLQVWVQKQGGAERVLSFGIRETSQLYSRIYFARNQYSFTLEPTASSGFVFLEEEEYFDDPRFGSKKKTKSGHTESCLKDWEAAAKQDSIEDYIYSSMLSWKVFHFHDTSDMAGVKRPCSVHDNKHLRPEASNLAAYLYLLQQKETAIYTQIRKTVALAIPFFDDFFLEPNTLPNEEQQIRLLWKQKDSDYAFWPSQLSDGSLRFICLVTVLMQPNPPSTIIIDEPELGLHPHAIVLLGSLIRANSNRTQIIVSTQSVLLLNEFSIDDLIVVEREEGASVFKRYNREDFSSWLENYSIGELWEKNILRGRPRK